MNTSEYSSLSLSPSSACRHQFYLHSRLELVESRLKVSDWGSVARLVALIAQADGGDYDALSPPHALYSQCCHIQPVEPCEPKPQDFLLRIIQQHKEIKVRLENYISSIRRRTINSIERCVANFYLKFAYLRDTTLCNNILLFSLYLKLFFFYRFICSFTTACFWFKVFFSSNIFARSRRFWIHERFWMVVICICIFCSIKIFEANPFFYDHWTLLYELRQTHICI